MGMIEAVLPTMPAAGVSIGTNRVAAVPQGWVTDGAVQGVAIKSAAAGLLFGMLMTQLAAGATILEPGEPPSLLSGRPAGRRAGSVEAGVSAWPPSDPLP